MKNSTDNFAPRQGRASRDTGKSVAAPTATLGVESSLVVSDIESMPDPDPVGQASASILSKIGQLRKMAYDLRDKYGPAMHNAARNVSCAITSGDRVSEEVVEAYANAKAEHEVRKAAFKALAREVEREYDHYVDDEGLKIGALEYTSRGIPCGLNTFTKREIYD